MGIKIICKRKRIHIVCKKKQLEKSNTYKKYKGKSVNLSLNGNMNFSFTKCY